MSSFGLAHIRAEGQPAHPEDVYTHCGCKKCDARFAKQGRAYFEFLKKGDFDLKQYHDDPWFPADMK